MYGAIIYSAEPSSAKSDGPVSETGRSIISRISDKASEATTADPCDWRTPLVRYLENPGHIADRKVQRQALKYVMLDNTLLSPNYRCLLLKYLNSDQSMITMWEVHEDICGTH
jgi:hypothetical protein